MFLLSWELRAAVERRLNENPDNRNLSKLSDLFEAPEEGGSSKTTGFSSSEFLINCNPSSLLIGGGQ
jgi:hypothetical protein